MSSQRKQLKQRRLTARVVAALSIAAASIVAAFGVPGLAPPEPAVPPIGFDPTAAPADPNENPSGSRPGQSANSNAYDSGLIVASLAGLANAPRPAEPEPTVDTGIASGSENTGSGDPGGREIRYIGRMAQRAVLVIDGAQRLLKTGDAHDDVELAQLETDFVIVDADGERRRIERETATGSRVSQAAAPAPLSTPQGGATSPVTDPRAARAAADRFRDRAVAKRLEAEGLAEIQEAKAEAGEE